MKTNSKGFTAVEIILVVLLIAAMGALGWYVWQANNKTTSTTSTTSQTSSNNQNQTTSSGSSSQNSTTNYLTINEWGVKAPYDQSKKLTYRIQNGVAYFSSSLISELDSTCTDSAGSIARYAPNDSVDAGDSSLTAERAAQQDPNNFKKVGNYYYIFAHAQSTCSNDAATTAQASTNDYVKSLVPNLIAL